MNNKSTINEKQFQKNPELYCAQLYKEVMYESSKHKAIAIQKLFELSARGITPAIAQLWRLLDQYEISNIHPYIIDTLKQIGETAVKVHAGTRYVDNEGTLHMAGVEGMLPVYLAGGETAIRQAEEILCNEYNKYKRGLYSATLSILGAIGTQDSVMKLLSAHDPTKNHKYSWSYIEEVIYNISLRHPLAEEQQLYIDYITALDSYNFSNRGLFAPGSYWGGGTHEEMEARKQAALIKIRDETTRIENCYRESLDLLHHGDENAIILFRRKMAQYLPERYREKLKDKNVGIDWDGDSDHVKLISRDDFEDIITFLGDAGLKNLLKTVRLNFFAESGDNVSGLEKGILVTQKFEHHSLDELNIRTENGESNELIEKVKNDLIEYVNKTEQNGDVHAVLSDIGITHPLKENFETDSVLWQYNPQNFIKRYMPTQELGKFFQEIPDAMERTTMTRKMDQVVKQFQYKELKSDPRIAEEIIKNTVMNEIFLTAFLWLSENEQNDLYRLIENGQPGRVYFKNRIKSLKMIHQYRKSLPQSDPAHAFPNSTTGKKAKKLFLMEMFSDLFPVFLYEKKQPGKHVYISILDENLTPDLSHFFESVLEKMKQKIQDNHPMIIQADRLAELDLMNLRHPKTSDE